MTNISSKECSAPAQGRHALIPNVFRKHITIKTGQTPLRVPALRFPLAAVQQKPAKRFVNTLHYLTKQLPAVMIRDDFE